MAFKTNYLTETLFRNKGLLYKNKYLFSNVCGSTCFRMKERHVGQTQRTLWGGITSIYKHFTILSKTQIYQKHLQENYHPLYTIHNTTEILAPIGKSAHLSPIKNIQCLGRNEVQQPNKSPKYFGENTTFRALSQLDQQKRHPLPVGLFNHPSVST